MKIMNVHQAKTQLSRLLEAVESGEDVVIARAGKPVARLVGYHSEDRDRTGGHWKGLVRIGADAPSRKAFTWFWNRLRADADLSQCEVWHEGRCGRCSRVLTVPESLQTGLGPVCASRR